MTTLLDLAVQVYQARDPALKLLPSTPTAYESPRNRVTFMFHPQTQSVSIQWVDVGTMTHYHGWAYSEAELHEVLQAGQALFEARRSLLQRVREAGFRGVISFKPNKVEVSQVVIRDEAEIRKVLNL